MTTPCAGLKVMTPSQHRPKAAVQMLAAGITPLAEAGRSALAYPGEDGQPRRALVVGQTPHVLVAVDPSLGQDGLRVAQECMARVEGDFLKLQGLFGRTAALPQAQLVVAAIGGATDGGGGAYHMGCDAAMLVACVDFADSRRTSALFIAELSEVGQAVQGIGWDCGATNGEGLSRVHAEALYPGVLDDFETASVWLDGSRPNWVSSNEATDTDPESNGCAALFIWWLVSIGYTLEQITQAAGHSLHAAYQSLTGRATAWDDFSSLVNLSWPPGQPSGVTVDNPWATRPPLPPPGEPPPGEPPPSGGGAGSSAPGGIPVTFHEDVPKGDYIFVPVSAELVRNLGGGVLTWAKLLPFVIALLRALGISVSGLPFTLPLAGGPPPSSLPPGS